MSIPLSRPIITEDAIDAVTRVMRSGMLAAGPEVAAFEEEFARACGAAHAVAVSNGTIALWLGLLALEIGDGDEVVIPSFTFAGTAGAVIMTGATPVYAEIDPITFCITADTAAACITDRTRAIMPVHLYGHMAPLADLAALCDSHDIHLIEDAAQAHGAAEGGSVAGSVGAFAGFSFYPTKNMTTGEGGMVTTQDDAIAERLRLLRNHGMTTRYHHEILGTNGRLTDMGAALGRVQLAHLAGWTKQRQLNAAHLTAELADVVTTPTIAPGTEHVFHQYTIRVDDRQRMMDALGAAGVGYGVYYPVGCHEQPAFAADVRLPHTEEACRTALSIPVRADLTEAELSTVVDAVKAGAA